MEFRATKQFSPPSEPNVDGREVSATWPTAAELEPGYASIEPGPLSGKALGMSSYEARFRGDLTEFFEPDDTDTLRIFPSADRHDTVPAPPPDLESAPWHDER